MLAVAKQLVCPVCGGDHFHDQALQVAPGEWDLAVHCNACGWSPNLCRRCLGDLRPAGPGLMECRRCRHLEYRRAGRELALAPVPSRIDHHDDCPAF